MFVTLIYRNTDGTDVPHDLTKSDLGLNWREEIVTAVINFRCSVIGFSFVLSIYKLCMRLKHRREENMNIINFTAEDDQTGDVENPCENDDPAAPSTPQLQSFENPFTTPQTSTTQTSTPPKLLPLKLLIPTGYLTHI